MAYPTIVRMLVAAAAGATTWATRWPPKIFVFATEESRFRSCGFRGVHHQLERWAVEAVQWRLAHHIRASDSADPDFVLVAQCFHHDFLQALQSCRYKQVAEECFSSELEALDKRIHRWIDAISSSPLHQRRNGTDFVMVIGAEHGRLAFPALAHPALRAWTFVTPRGPSSWLRERFVAEAHCGFASPRYPPIPWDIVTPLPSLLNWTASSAQQERPRLAFFAGAINSCVRRELFRNYGCDLESQGVAVCNQGFGERYSALLHETTFCLVPDGRSSPWTWRFFDVIRAGCIPTVVSDDFHPPFHRTIDWMSAAIFVRVAHIPWLEKLLRAVPKAAIESRQRALFELATSIDPREVAYWELLLEELRQAAAAKSMHATHG